MLQWINAPSTIKQRPTNHLDIATCFNTQNLCTGGVYWHVILYFYYLCNIENKIGLMVNRMESVNWVEILVNVVCLSFSLMPWERHDSTSLCCWYHITNTTYHIDRHYQTVLIIQRNTMKDPTWYRDNLLDHRVFWFDFEYREHKWIKNFRDFLSIKWVNQGIMLRVIID